MKKDRKIKLEKEKYRRLKEMPDFIADFIQHHENKFSIMTQISYIKCYTIFLEYLLELPEFKHRKSIRDITLEDLKVLTTRDIRHFLSYLTSYTKTFKRKDGMEVTQTFTNDDKGKSTKLAALHTLYNWFSKEGYDIEDITKHIEIKIKEKQDIKNSLNGKEIDRFVDIIINDVNIENERKLKFHKRLKFRDLTILLILAFTGIRISELVDLDISDINTEYGALIVTRKGESQQKLYIPDRIVSTIEEYIEQRKKVEDVPTEYKEALFLSSQKKRIHPRTVRYMLEKYKERAGIDIKVTPHTLRRSFAMRFYNDTGDIQLTADQLGHKTTETTRKFYAKPEEERRKRIMKNFDYRTEEDNDSLSSELQALAIATGQTVEEIKKKLGL